MANINSQLKTDRNSSDLGSTIIRLGGWNLRKRPIGDKRLFISKTYSCSISLSSLIWYQEGFNFSVEWWYYQNETWSDPSSKVIWRLERKLSENIPLWTFYQLGYRICTYQNTSKIQSFKVFAEITFFANHVSTKMVSVAEKGGCGGQVYGVGVS